MSTSRTMQRATRFDGMHRVDLRSLLIDEVLRLLDPGTPETDLTIPQPRTPEELHEFLRSTLGITLPNTSVCKGHSNPFAAFCDSYFGQHPVVVWKASRGYGGKTFSLAALSWTEAVTLRASVTILGGSGEQSERVHDYMRSFWMKPTAPTAALPDDPSSKRSRLLWGNTINALMASARSVSGPHPQRLRCDEVDLIDLKILHQALGQPMSKDGIPAQTTLSSAHYEPDGTFTAVLNMAAQRGWPVHEWCYRETVEPHGWTTAQEIQRQRMVVPAAMWAVQYDLQEPSPEGRSIVPEKVEAMFLGPTDLPNYYGKKAVDRIAPMFSATSEPRVIRDDNGEVFEFELPTEGAEYATGGDWARENHDCVFWTIRTDVTPMRLVSYQRFTRLPEPVMTARFNAQVKRYPGPAAHDATGMGVVIKDSLASEADIDHFTMVGKPRQELFSNYIAGVERGEVVAPRIAHTYQNHKFVKNNDLYGSGHPPDSIVAAAMAYRAATTHVALRVLNADTDANAKAQRAAREALDRAANFLAPPPEEP